MREGKPRLGYELGELFGKELHRLYGIVKEIHLPAAADLLQDRLADERLAVFGDESLHGIARLGRGLDNAHVADAGKAHVERAGDGSCGKGQHID